MKRVTGAAYCSPIGEPESSVRDPSALIVNSEMELSNVLAVYRILPLEEMVNPKGFLPREWVRRTSRRKNTLIQIESFDNARLNLR